MKKKLIEYTYTFKASDPNGDNVSYFVDWGDDTSTGWTEYVPSGTMVSLNHTWSKRGKYTIRAKAQDIHGADSNRTTFKVRMPKNQQATSNPLFFQLLERLINSFPSLRQIMGV